ncbi:MAG: FAD-binding protein [Bacteroidetes bacterium]|nr:FAD-binding protein [Bacteroidota bacterium]
MDKRTFLQTTAVLIGGGAVVPFWGCTPRVPARTNWAGNLTYSTNQLYRLGTVEEVQEIVRRTARVRPLGSRHCFNTIADSQHAQLSLELLPREITFDEGTVSVPGSMRYGELIPFLDERGVALHNLASLPHISVAGACATATHGSGIAQGNLATAVQGMEIVTASGELVSLSRETDGQRFAGAVVGLGSLGVVTRVALRTEPSYNIRQHVYLDIPLDSIGQHFEEISALAYSVSIFTDWQTTESTQIWLKERAVEGMEPLEQELFGGRLADRKVHPVLALSAEACTEQMGAVAPWHALLPHFKMEFTPSSGEELQTEFFVAKENAPAVVEVLRGMSDRLNPLLMISEVRSIKSDDLWMSTAYGRDSVAFHFTWYQDWEALQALLPALEEALHPFDIRPHWGKNFGMEPAVLRSRYERLNDFRALVGEFDPSGKFRNEFTQRYLFG